MPNSIENEIKDFLDQVSVIKIVEDEEVADDILTLTDIINGTQYKLLCNGDEVLRSDFDIIPNADVLLHFNNVLDSEHYFDL